VQGGNTDFLICAVSLRRKISVFTTDQDFNHYAKILPLKLHEVRADLL
jgi:predicted nucleic acid-binding protein